MAERPALSLATAAVAESAEPVRVEDGVAYLATDRYRELQHASLALAAAGRHTDLHLTSPGSPLKPHRQMMSAHMRLAVASYAKCTPMAASSSP